MKKEKLKPHGLWTFDEIDQLGHKIPQAKALADVIYTCLSGNGGDGPEPESLNYATSLLFCELGDINDLWQKGMDRKDKGQVEDGPQQTPV